MIVVDVNLLVAAFRADHPHHSSALPWLEETLEHGPQLVVPDLVWAGFLRVATNARVFPVPATMEEAADFLDAIRAQPGCLELPDVPALDRFVDLCRTQQIVGNLVTDAYIAAVALSLGASVATFDRDFRRFDHLRVIEPPTLTA